MHRYRRLRLRRCASAVIPFFFHPSSILPSSFLSLPAATLATAALAAAGTTASLAATDAT